MIFGFGIALGFQILDVLLVSVSDFNSVRISSVIVD